MKLVFLLAAICCFGFTLLRAADAAEETMTEEGWFHSFTAGRYGDLNRSAILPERLFGGTDFFATLRTMWIDTHRGRTKQTAVATGGSFGLATEEFYGFSGLIGVQASRMLWCINSGNPDAGYPERCGAGGEAFTYISEAELSYNTDGLFLRAGRMKVQTPYAGPDDIRMAYNTFEGAAASYAFSDTLTANLFYFSRWAGFDSGEAQSRFVRLADNADGMLAAGLVYAPDEENQASLWFYHVDRQYDLFYAEAVGRAHFSPHFHLEWGVQAAQMRALGHSGIEGSVAGATGMLHYRRFYGGAAYNRASVADGQVVTDGFGGGPYFTSLDESTVAAASELAPGHNLSVYRVGGGINLGRGAQGEGLQLEGVYGFFDPEGTPASVAETDLLLRFDPSPSLRVDAVFASFDTRQCDHPEFSDFRRYWIRVAYAF